MAPIQDGGVTSSTNMAPMQDLEIQYTADAGKTSKGSVFIEQGQPLRAAEPDRCALEENEADC